MNGAYRRLLDVAVEIIDELDEAEAQRDAARRELERERARADRWAAIAAENACPDDVDLTALEEIHDAT